MQLTAITVSVNYSDFLCHALLWNKALFSKWIVVTDTKDTITKDLCVYHNVTCIQTDVFYEGGGFNKYAGINEALKKVTKDEWVLFLDSDIILPPHTKRTLECLELDKKSIYGTDRLDCVGVSEYMKFVNHPRNLIDNWLVSSCNLQLGSRIAHIYGQKGDNGKFSGWKPLGFFQLAHSSQFSMYPQDCKGADHCDIVFANLYNRINRIMIPEILPLHLVSEDATWSSNWNGRKTAPFLPAQYSNTTTTQATQAIKDNPDPILTYQQ